MNIRSVTLPVFTLAFSTALAAVAPLHAQNNGFRIGQPQPAPPQNLPTTSGPLLIAPMTSPIQPTANPIAPIGGPVGPQNTPQKTTRAQENFAIQGTGAVTILPAGGTIFVPAGTMVIQSGFGMEPGAFLSAPLAPVAPATPPTPPDPPSPAAPATPSGARTGGTSIDRTVRPTTVNQQVTPPDVTRLALGTTREKVIEKYGNPIAFIMNMNGETLYFRDGVVVFIKDGVVAVPGTLPTTTRP
jgi:hypothetical protein